MSIIAYISGHGLGHSAREVEVLRHLPAAVPLVIKTVAPEWFWRRELGRPFELIADQFDVGCAQKDGLDIDVAGTLVAWRAMQERNRFRLEEEAEWLKQVGARVVVSDVPSFPALAARIAGIPSILIANFTWGEIYQGLAAQEPEFIPIVDQLGDEYAEFTLALETWFAVPMHHLRKIESVGLVARPGQARRDTLLAALPAEASQKRLALVYVGGWGLPIPYEQVTQFTDWHFLSLDAPPTVPANWSVLSRNLMDHPDLVASVDLVISKPGYGLAGECVTLGTPLLYPPRPEFAEYAALDSVLASWAGGCRISREDFLNVHWRESLEWAATVREVPRLPAPGGPVAAQRIREMMSE